MKVQLVDDCLIRGSKEQLEEGLYRIVVSVVHCTQCSLSQYSTTSHWSLEPGIRQSSTSYKTVSLTESIIRVPGKETTLFFFGTHMHLISYFSGTILGCALLNRHIIAISRVCKYLKSKNNLESAIVSYTTLCPLYPWWTDSFNTSDNNVIVELDVESNRMVLGHVLDRHHTIAVIPDLARGQPSGQCNSGQFSYGINNVDRLVAVHVMDYLQLCYQSRRCSIKDTFG